MKTCTQPDCDEQHKSKGYCNRHAIQIRRHGHITDAVTIYNLPGEIWRNIDGEKHYKISNYARVISSARSPERLLTPYFNKNTVLIRLGEKQPSKRLHIELAKAFIFNAQNDTRVTFIDNDKTNIQLGNLQWNSLYKRETAINMLIESLSGENHLIANTVLNFMDGNPKLLNDYFIAQYKYFKNIAFWQINKNTGYFEAIRLVDDAVQSGFLNVISALKKGMFYKPENFDGWIATVIRNAAKNTCFVDYKTVSINDVNRNGEEYSLIEITR